MDDKKKKWAFFEAPGVIPDGKGGGICRACGALITNDIAGAVLNQAEVYAHDCSGKDPEKAAADLAKTKTEMRKDLERCL